MDLCIVIYSVTFCMLSAQLRVNDMCCRIDLDISIIRNQSNGCDATLRHLSGYLGHLDICFDDFEVLMIFAAA